MKPVYKYVLLPAILTLVFFAVAAMPVEILGCRNRGLLAFSIALAGLLVGLGVAGAGLWARMRRKPYPRLMAATIIILAIPAVYIIYLEYCG